MKLNVDAATETDLLTPDFVILNFGVLISNVYYLFLVLLHAANFFRV